MTTFEPKQFGKYYLVEKIAVGGMAEIYKAKTYGVDGFEKLCVLKRILPHCSADRDFISMLVDEAKLSVTLSHANIVQVYDLGKVGDDYFISMEFIGGVNLRDIIYRCRDRGIKIPPELAAYVISEVCKGLDYAHRKTDVGGKPLNIVHRDVSPQNILISYEGEVKIVDFGIAKAAMNISHTMAGILKGKIAYMSPEQALGKTVDYHTDIFSAGIVLHEALTAEKLFTGESQFEVLKKIRSTKIDVTKLPEAIPFELRSIIAKALAYYQKDRYQSAGEMQIDLTKYLYTTYVDFTPQKLAAFIKELFAEEIARQLERGVLEQVVEAQTSSINIAEEALQENIVHREETSETMRTEKAEFAGSLSKVEEAAGEGVAKKGLAQRFLGAGIVLVLLAGVSFAFYKFIYPRISGGGPTTSEKISAVSGTANVTSEPAGAKIFLNDRDTELATPAILESLAIGKTYTVRVSKEKFEDGIQTVTVTNADPVNVNFMLNEARGVLEIKTDPEGAAVFVDGEETGFTTPTTLNGVPLEQDVKISLVKQQFKAFEQVIKLNSSKPQVLIARLVPAEGVGTVGIVSNPGGAQIFLNGRDTGLVTPASVQGIPVGEKQSIRLFKAGYETEAREVTLQDAAPLAVSVDMKSLAPATTAALTPAPAAPTPPAPTAPTPALKQETAKKEAKKSEPKQEPKKEPVKEPKQEPKREPPAPAPTPAPQYGPDVAAGSIKIGSSPSGADVFVNAEHRGVTPITVTGIRPGAVSILVNKEGKSRFSQKVNLKPGETLDLGTVKLGELFGEVSIDSSPSHAKIFFDGGDIGAKTPVTVRKVRRDKTHSLKLVLEGYKTWERSFDMGDTESKKFDVQLEREE